MEYATLLGQGHLGNQVGKGQPAEIDFAFGKLINPEGHEIAAMSPVIFRKESLASAHSRIGVVNVGIARAYRKHEHRNFQRCVGVHPKGIKLIEPNPPFMLKVEPEILDNGAIMEDVPRLNQVAKEDGIKFYRLANFDIALDLAEVIWLGLSDEFKYISMITCSGLDTAPASSKFMSDRVIPIVGFYDLKYFIPIYDRSKATGLGVRIMFNFELTTRKHGPVHTLFLLEFIGTMHRTNTFFLDGTNLLPKRSPSQEIFSKFRDTVKYLVKMQKMIDGGGPRVEEEKKRNKAIRSGYYSDITTISTSSNSNSSYNVSNYIITQ